MIENPKTGARKQVKIGYSWTMFFFGGFVLLFRRDWIVFAISLLVLFTLVELFPATTHPTNYAITLMWSIFAFFYNDLYLKTALKGNWIPADATSRNRLYEKGYVKTHCYDLEQKEEN